MSTQCERMVQALREGPVHTIEARRILGIVHPADVIYKLRRRGYWIDMLPSIEVDDIGYLHEVAKYHLIKEPE